MENKEERHIEREEIHLLSSNEYKHKCLVYKSCLFCYIEAEHKKKGLHKHKPEEF